MTRAGGSHSGCAQRGKLPIGRNEAKAEILNLKQPRIQTWSPALVMAWGEHERRNGMLIALHLVKEDARRRRGRRRRQEGEN